ncbi:hypothetical protein DFH09DRAFT_1323323 [Mycena vulgaris]|nr:hypothetical protein DFH09DRAFT_1323323 [Mycena vulgaris]
MGGHTSLVFGVPPAPLPTLLHSCPPFSSSSAVLPPTYALHAPVPALPRTLLASGKGGIGAFLAEREMTEVESREAAACDGRGVSVCTSYNGAPVETVPPAMHTRYADEMMSGAWHGVVYTSSSTSLHASPHRRD